MNEMNKNTAVKDNRRYKYGSLSIAFTVVFIAFVLILNLFLSSLSLKGDLTVDLTQEEFTAISDETITLLSALGKDLDITITFMWPRDRFDQEISGNTANGINLLTIIRDLTENYAKTFDGSGELGTVRVQYKELDTDPEFEKKVLEETTTQLKSSSVIVAGKHHYRVLDFTSFLTMNENGELHSFNGEYRLTSAILQSSITDPQVVTFTYGNGEGDITENGEITVNDSAYGLKTILENAGFIIKTANLDSEELDPNTEILITYDPEVDFSEVEIKKLNSYLDARNSFIMFVDAATPELKNIQSILSDNWGINYRPNYRVSDKTHSLGGKTGIINAKYATIASDSRNNSAAYQIFKTAGDVDGVITTAMPESVELVKGENHKSAIVETILTTYNTAISDNNGEAGTSETEIPLMMLSTYGDYSKENNDVYEYSYVMLVGSTDFASTAALNVGAYGNKRMMLSAARVFGANRVAPDIESRQFISSALTIETGTARTLTWLICTILPGAVLIMGIVMFFKRRHL